MTLRELIKVLEQTNDAFKNLELDHGRLNFWLNDTNHHAASASLTIWGGKPWTIRCYSRAAHWGLHREDGPATFNFKYNWVGGKGYVGKPRSINKYYYLDGRKVGKGAHKLNQLNKSVAVVLEAQADIEVGI